MHAQPEKKRRRAGMRLLAWGLVAALLAFTAYVYFNDPFKGGVTFCTFHTVTGLDCPGCGMTRAAYLLLHGHPIQALQQNPFILVILLAAYMALAELSPHLIGKQLKQIVLPNWVLIALGAALVLYTLARNLPHFL